jgi:hypothetical protein
MSQSSRDRVQDLHANTASRMLGDLLPERRSGLDGDEDDHQGAISEKDRKCRQRDRDPQSLYTPAEDV